ncbi:helix-turn-helix transcriptional regulator [Streptomyces albidoflavus]|uniref:helix-turn-helix transcriptional regulator n=1 Tax=Streptomyces albidoflavus TaxID=1886 RepID=UPI0033305627
MYEIGTQVRYHGSIEPLRGEIFTIVRHEAGRYRIHGIATLSQVRHGSITPTAQEAPRAELERAIAAEQPVMITYVSADGEWTTRTIEPYELFRTRDGHLIVRAMDHLRGEPRSFRLDRITDLDVLPGAFHLDRAAAEQERAALARIRNEIAEVSSWGYGRDEARWSPGDPIL